MWKRGEIAPQEQFLLFSTLFYIYIFLTSGGKLHIHLLNVVVQFINFLTLSTLICRSMDSSKCFSESLGIRDNGSRLYSPLTDTQSLNLLIQSLKAFSQSFSGMPLRWFNMVAPTKGVQWTAKS